MSSLKRGLSNRIGWFICVLILALSVLPACSKPAEGEAKPKKKPVPVRVVELKARDLPVIVESVGRLAANREVTLAAEVGGVAAAYKADVGQRVKAGQTLILIDPVDFRLALSEARANQAAAQARLDAAAKTYNRSKNLLPRKVISTDTFEKSEAEYKAALANVARAKALVNIARERYSKTRIRAPFDGLVAARSVEIGQTVAPGQPLMSLVDLDTMRVKVSLAERDYVHLDRKDPVRVTIEAFPDREFPGRIDVIGIKADPRTNTFGAEVLVNNPDLILKAGLTARVRLTVSTIPGAVMVPQSAVLYREDRQEVFVVGPDNRAELRRVKLGRAVGSAIRITEGLAPGDRLVVTGQQYLKPTDRVIVSVSGRTKTP